jgi:hypothetical protein
MRRDRFTALRGYWDGEEFVTDEDFTYRSEEGDITVPAGFRTDFDSVPRLPLAYWLTKGRTLRGAVIHDWLYSCQQIDSKPISRAKADSVFLQAMSDEGAGPTRYAIWLGVRIGGLGIWRRHSKFLPHPLKGPPQ